MSLANTLGQLVGALTGTVGVPGTIVSLAVLVAVVAAWRSV